MKTIKINKISDIPKNYTGIVEHFNGDKYWLLNGEYHREDGPAIEYSFGEKQWFLNGKLHRKNGPAVIFSDTRKGYWLNGEPLNKDKINQFVKKFDYPIEVAIKLTHWLEINKS